MPFRLFAVQINYIVLWRIIALRTDMFWFSIRILVIFYGYKIRKIRKNSIDKGLTK